MSTHPPLSPEMTGYSTPDPLRMAFSGKTSAHVNNRPQPLTPEQQVATWQRLMADPGEPGKRLAYFHIPFCRTHCSYCGFFQNASKPGLIEQYVDALIREIEITAASPRTQARPIHAVYFGGGTPTDLTPEQITRLGDAIRQHLPLSNDCEMTFESRFSGLSDDKMAACMSAGFNRFSLGAQTFDTFIRRKMSRIDAREVLLERLDQLVSLDQAAVVIDLLFGLPYQTLDTWEEDLHTLINSDIHGADLYQLVLHGTSRMAKSIEKGAMPEPADNAMKATMFLTGLDILSQHNFRRLSVSHWARDGRERNIYNHSVKAGAEIIPFGSGAGGNIAGHGIMMHRSLEPYFGMIAAGRKPIMAMTAPKPMRQLHNVIGGGFDLGWLDMKRIQRTIGYDVATHCAPLFDAWVNNGLAEYKGDFLELTLAGQFWNINMNQGLIHYMEASPFEELAA
ncbi:heme anaerobic degradation radical SAM methyltransferase ChuW/HutW [Kistimonas asteriae]|uniref:heme anaerobic degradation radical SAM methyltransferase ChuW/HutW n=1 Tax=Kistimonas asteriae TaxID=517724 RepID=UPI001BA44B59|nr:heme anaerobic degradation radical SAM methyltransferase ChuW/HutW [Kistimonas asteriae]